jgi:hypothetical protein
MAAVLTPHMLPVPLSFTIGVGEELDFFWLNMSKFNNNMKQQLKGKERK